MGECRGTSRFQLKHSYTPTRDNLHSGLRRATLCAFNPPPSATHELTIEDTSRRFVGGPGARWFMGRYSFTSQSGWSSSRDLTNNQRLMAGHPAVNRSATGQRLHPASAGAHRAGENRAGLSRDRSERYPGSSYGASGPAHTPYSTQGPHEPTVKLRVVKTRHGFKSRKPAGRQTTVGYGWLWTKHHILL